LVAPVLEAGARERNVYLPMMEGAPDKTVVWKRVTDGTYYKGGQWLNGTKVLRKQNLFSEMAEFHRTKRENGHFFTKKKTTEHLNT
jgi:alpha-glucosidase (family GH31 glycosyl hydrolase)